MLRNGLEPWHLLIARALVGFILGNTGVMYAMLSDITPRRQLATAIAFIGAGSTLGVSVGPFVAGWLVASVAPLVAVLLWKSYGGSIYAPELASVAFGHLLNAGLTIALAALTAASFSHGHQTG